MTEPSRLLRGEATAFERRLLEAAVNERPPAELFASMEQALTGSAVAAKAGASASATSALGYAALAALAAGGAVVALVLLREPPSAPTPPPREVPARAVTAPGPDVTARAPEPVVEPLPEVVDEPRREVVNELPRAPQRAVKASSSSELRDEIRLMDRARAALRSGAPDQALSLLGRYTQRFPNGAFRQEATVLELEALERAGQRRKASSLAQKFLDEHPESPHVERVGRTASGK